MKYLFRNCKIGICIFFLLLRTIWGNVILQGQTNAGMQFLLTEFSTHADSYVTIFNPNDNDAAEVDVKLANSQYRHLYLQTNKSYTFKIPSSLRVNGIGVFNKVVKICSINKVEIKAMIHTYNQSVNAMMLSPKETYDREYYPVADCVYTSVIYVFATDKPAVVNITFPNDLNEVFMHYDGLPYKGGETLVLQLKSETFGRLESNRSLSGSLIVSNEKIAVYSGCDSFAYPEHFSFEQVPGVNFVGKHYVLISNSESDYNLEYFQIITTQPDTKLKVENGQCAIRKFNEQGFTAKDFFADTFVVIEANKPVVVAHFIYDNEYSMYYVTPKENDDSSYKVVIAKEQISAMTLNYEKNVDHSLMINNEVINGFTPYTTKLQWLNYGRISSLFPNVTIVTIQQMDNAEFGGYIHGKYNGRLAVTSLGQRFETIRRTCAEDESESINNCEHVDVSCDQTTASTPSNTPTTPQPPLSSSTSSPLELTTLTTSTTSPSTPSTTSSSTLASSPSDSPNTLEETSSTTSNTKISSSSTFTQQSAPSSTTTATVITQSSTLPPTNPSNPSCKGMGYSLFSSGINSICYWQLNYDDSMTGSTQGCSSSGGQLAIIPSFEANAAVAQLNLSGDDYYIGYTSNPNGAVTVLNKTAAWTNFENGQPKNFTCIFLHSSSKNQWRGTICTALMNALCSRCFYGGTACYDVPQTSVAMSDTTAISEPTAIDDTTAISAPTTIEDTTAISEPTTIEDTTAISAPTTIEDNTAISEPTTIEDTTAISEPTTIEDTTAISAPTTIEDNTAISEPTTIKDTTAISETTTIEDNTAISEPTTIEDTTAISEPTAIEDTTAISEPKTIEDTTAISEPTTIEDTTANSEPTTIEDTTAISELTTIEESSGMEDTTPTTESTVMTNTAIKSKSTTVGTTLSTLSTASSTSNDECNCRCYTQYYIKPVNMTKQLAHYLSQLKSRIAVNKRTLSVTTRKKTCADDPRPTAKVSGYAGAFVLTFVFGGLVALDVPLLIAEIKINLLGIGQ